MAISVAALLAVVSGPSANAHGGRVPIDEWGGFAPDVSRCQRVIHHHTARCAIQTARLRTACRAQQAAGQACDSEATSAAIVDVRRAALDAVDLVCSVRQLTELGYLGLFDFQTDVIAACRSWENLAASAAYGPATSSLPSASLGCTHATARATEQLSSLAIRSWRRSLDRLAVRELDSAAQARIIERAERRTTAAGSAWLASVRQACTPETFATLYGQSIDERADRLAAVTNCIAGAICIQEGVNCPEPICGNGLQEPGEQCDDGNDDDGDLCTTSCFPAEP